MHISKIHTKHFSKALDHIKSHTKIKKSDSKSIKKIAKTASKFLADAVKHGKHNKIIRSVKKTKSGGIKVKLSTDSGKTREYHFKGKHLNLAGL